MAHPAVAALERHFTGYRRAWHGDAIASLAQPLLVILAFGVLLGSYVGDIDGVRYLDYIVPGMVVAAALQVAIGDATYPVRGYLFWQRHYHVQIAAPLRVADVLAGHVGFSACRVAASSALFLAVAWPAGALHSPWALAAIPVSVLVALAAGLPTFAFSASVGNPTYLELVIRCGVLPLTLFAGVFFPVEALPVAVRPLAYASPLWHGVDLARAATLGVAPEWSIAGHLAYLALWMVAGWLLAHRAFQTQLHN